MKALPRCVRCRNPRAIEIVSEKTKEKFALCRRCLLAILGLVRPSSRRAIKAEIVQQARKGH